MLVETDALQIADVYGLGGDALLSGPVAQGEVGQVWRLATSRGEWAVKEPFARPSTDEANDDAAFQDEVVASGVSMPKVVRTTTGEVLAELIGQLAAAGADFSEPLAEQRDELVALEELLEWPTDIQTCHRDLFADNVVLVDAVSG